MSQQPEPRKEHPSTYFVQDRSNDDERKRVHLQDLMVTKRMGGVLPEQPDPTRFRRVLDVGCGTGGWLIEAAKTYPEIELLIGIDVSKHIIEYAREQAVTEGVADRVEFHTMDALQYIAFPKNYFDLVNQRFGWSYLRTWDWPNLLTKYQYVSRRGGIIRVTEGATFELSTSPAFTQLSEMGFEAFYRAGHFFTHDRQGFANTLPTLFRNHGIKDVQACSTLFEYRAGSEMMESLVDNVKLGFRTALPFFRKWGHVPDNYEELYQQAIEEIQQPDCLTTGKLVTVWGTWS